MRDLSSLALFSMSFHVSGLPFAPILIDRCLYRKDVVSPTCFPSALNLEPRAGFEPAAHWIEARCSVR